MNQKADFFTKRIDSHNESNRVQLRIGMLYLWGPWNHVLDGGLRSPPAESITLAGCTWATPYGWYSQPYSQWCILWLLVYCRKLLCDADRLSAWVTDTVNDVGWPVHEFVWMLCCRSLSLWTDPNCNMINGTGTTQPRSQHCMLHWWVRSQVLLCH